MHSVLFSILAFVALTTAVPYAVHGRHGVVRRALSEHVGPTQFSYDGSCGSWSGATCRPGDCCGAGGWCGSSPEFCGAGCQSGFGKCDAGSSPGNESSGLPATAVTSTSPEAAQPALPTYGSPSSPSAAPNYTTFVSMASTLESPSAARTDTTSVPVASTPESPTAAPTDTTSVSTVSTPGSSSVAPTYSAPVSTSRSPSATPTDTTPVPTPSSPSVAPTGAPIPSSPSAAPTDTAPVSVTGSTSAAPTGTASAASSYGSSPPASPSGVPITGGGGPYIKPYSGDGGTGWPDENQWLPFETLWALNLPNMKKSCSNLGYGADNSEQELADIKASIEELSKQCNVDARFALAIMEQESGGCVRVKSTANANLNPGLFQSHAGSGSCIGIDPCPQAQIHQMVQDGVCGTAAGPGLQQLLAGGSGAQKYYLTARMYNSGSPSPDGDLAHGGATPCYCSDIANRLIGWSVGPSTCQAGAVAA